MVHAVIMIETATAKSTEIQDAIGELGDVTDAHVVAGDYDVIAEVGADEVYQVLNTASNEIQGIDGVTETKTYVALG